MIREGFGRVSATGVAYDFGVQHRGIAGLENLEVGFALKNFGQPMKYDGEGLGVFATASGSDRPEDYYKIDAASIDLPFIFDMGLKYNIAGADLGATYTSNYYSTDELKFYVGYGVEGLGSVGIGFQTSGVAQELNIIKKMMTTITVMMIGILTHQMVFLLALLLTCLDLLALI